MSKHHGANRQIMNAVRLALAGGAILSGTMAYGQDEQELEQVVVTGSRIAAPNSVSISPVVSVTMDQIQQRGITRVEDMLNSLPQVYAGQSSAVSNGSDGTATVDLRGLGSQRTLVLVNGRRLGPGDPGTSASDLNQIPAQLVERVEVLTGGASSVYGADAVAGVVNFVLNDRFEGVKATASYGMYVHNQNNPDDVQGVLRDFNEANNQNFLAAPRNAYEGDTQDYSVMFGFNTEDGKGNLTSYITYRKVEGVLQSQYDYSTATLGSGYSGGSYDNGGAFQVSGSSTGNPGRYRLVNEVGRNVSGTFGGGSKGFVVDPDTGDFNVAGFNNSMRYNFGPTNYYMRPNDRYTAGAFAHYEFSEHADVFTQVQYVNDHTKAQIAPSGSFYGSVIAGMSCSNPLFNDSMRDQWCANGDIRPTIPDPDDEDLTIPNPDYDPAFNPDKNINLLVGRRNTEGKPRVDDITHTAVSYVLGSKGAINDAWDYEAYGQIGITELSEVYTNDVSIQRVRNALDVVADEDGNPVCRSVVAGYDSSCVPWNIWQQGGVSQQALDYIQIPLVSTGKVTQYVVNANFTGDLGQYGIQMPTAKDSMRTNVGVEYRSVESEFNPDANYISGDASGQGSPTLPTAGTISATEAFAEIRLPLIDDMAFASSLAVEAGYRYSDYNLGFSTDTYKFGLEWSPVRSVRLRGSYARAVRAPNVFELFNPVHVGINGASDNCAGVSLSDQAAWEARCLQQGLTADYFNTIDPNPAAQYNGEIGGNPELAPESATTVSFGIGWMPEFLRGFRVQVDYFDIEIDDVIRRVGQDTTLNLCASQNVFCDRINRDINGSLWVSPLGFVEDPLDNNGSLRTKGVDVELTYGFDIGSAGGLNLQLVGTYVDSYEVLPLQSLPETEYDCKGLFGNTCGTPTYEWRHTFNATWNTPWLGASLTATWRYFDSVMVDALDSNPNLNQGSVCTPGFDPDVFCVSNTDAELAAHSIFDLTAAMDVMENVNVRMGINNVLDEDPPLIGQSNLSGGNGNTYPQFYDALGRYIFATVSVQF